MCACPVGDTKHTLYECPIVNDDDNACIQQTNYLIHDAIAGVVENPCLWLRGLLPSHFTKVDPELDNIVDNLIYSYDKFVLPIGEWTSGLYFGDGAGGRDNRYPTIRRCGVGVARMIGEEYIGGVYCKLPGQVQTVPRAEATALLVLLHHMAHNSIIEFVSDNETLVDAFNAGRHHCRRILNSDIYDEIFGILDCKNIKILVRWMPSHLIDLPDKI